jgi:hypothetical protein
MAFSDVARWLDHAKLSFVASAHLLDHVEAVRSGQKLLSGISHPDSHYFVLAYRYADTTQRILALNIVCVHGKHKCLLSEGFHLL